MFKAAEKGQKVSHYVIEQIRTAILSGEFKPGDRLASEKELSDQFQVSKASMREAIRVLEVMGLITICKGAGGGIFVARVDMNTTVHNLTNFLHFKNVSIRDVTMVRVLMDPPLARIAAVKASPADIERLAAMADEEGANSDGGDPEGIGFHRFIARLSENPLLILLMDFVESQMADIKLELQPGPDFYADVRAAHYRILECFRRKNARAAGHEMLRHVLSVGNHLAALAGVAPFNGRGIEMELARETGVFENLFEPDERELLDSLTDERPADLGGLFKHVATGDLYVFRSHAAADRDEP